MIRILFFLVVGFVLIACQPLAFQKNGQPTPVDFITPRVVQGTMTLTYSPETTPVPLMKGATNVNEITPCPLVAGTMTARIPVTETMQAVFATESQIAPEVDTMGTATAAAASTQWVDSSAFCSNLEPYCVINGHFLFQRPIGPGGNDSVDYTYRYGTTQSFVREPHHGVEFPNKEGTPVLVVADGVVVYAGNDKKDVLAWVPAYYGNVVVVEHHFPGFSPPVYSLYAHLYKISVSVGQKVHAGAQIGQVGATGTAIGSHLHFEVRVGQNKYISNRNPELWLKPLAGTGVLSGWIRNQKSELIAENINVQRIKEGVLDPNPVTLLVPYYYKELQPVGVDDLWKENFSAGELEIGTYRLTFHHNGSFYERIITIEEGKLTFIRLFVK